ncbi:histidine phosphotransferase family protein [Frigidibacter sp. MR17.24]|uniref:histidine phosphotransferase family protein n=1 Tax=Frigidibacter sp. MR17.24 TaxID=3127345 RepID=UPI003012A9F2
MSHDISPLPPVRAEDLLPLLGSRICHDLISPLGAISNGLELLQMSGMAPGPEIELIGQSVASANARVKFYRLAFGAGSSQRIGAREVAALLEEISLGSRLKLVWQGEGDVIRSELKLGFLALQCLETALPWGGEAALSHEARRWTVTGSAARMKIDTDLWALIDDDREVPLDIALTAAHVHFGLLVLEARRQNRCLVHEVAMAEPPPAAAPGRDGTQARAPGATPAGDSRIIIRF